MYFEWIKQDRFNVNGFDQELQVILPLAPSAKPNGRLADLETVQARRRQQKWQKFAEREKEQKWREDWNRVECKRMWS